MTRFVRFNVVGIVGLVVQLGALIAFDRMGIPIVPATALAVEAALLHNFFWHERWTWAGVTSGSRAGRLARFHASNGVLSIAGNIALTSALVHAGAPLVVANVAAVLMCALLNFATAHVWVFCAKTWPTFHGHLQ
jgi:putative flippase GtrA